MGTVWKILQSEKCDRFVAGGGESKRERQNDNSPTDLCQGLAGFHSQPRGTTDTADPYINLCSIFNNTHTCTYMNAQTSLSILLMQ